MTEFITEGPFVLEEDDEFEYPSYNKPGRILVVVTPSTGSYHFDYDVLDYDDDSAVFYISEGVGFAFWLDEEDISGPGIYVIEGITGSYTRGDGWETDDDEEFYSTNIRLATGKEIATETLE